MIMYARVANEKNKICEVGVGSNEDFYKSIGMVPMEVEKGYDGNWYVKGNTPQKTQEVLLQEAKYERDEAVSKVTVEVDGMTFDGDEKSQTRIGRTIAAAVALGLDLTEEKRTWVLSDNSIAEVTIAQLAEVLRLAGDATTALWIVPYKA